MSLRPPKSFRKQIFVPISTEKTLTRILNDMPPKKVIPDKGKGKGESLVPLAGRRQFFRSIRSSTLLYLLAAPPPPPPPTSRPVTVAPVLWQDNASSKVAPGGGILRIAFDQADFERACQDVIVNPRKEAPKPQQETASIQENEGTTAASGIVEETPAVKVKEKKLPVKKEDVALIVRTVPALLWPRACHSRLTYSGIT